RGISVRHHPRGPRRPGGAGGVFPGHESHRAGRGPPAPRHAAVLGGSAGGRLKGDPRMARVRTFIAVDIGKSIRDKIVALQESLARAGTEVKWVEPENLHVSLLFLGEVDLRDVPEICRSVAECCRRHAPFSLSVETAGCFPNARRPRVLWVGVREGTQ